MNTGYADVDRCLGPTLSEMGFVLDEIREGLTYKERPAWAVICVRHCWKRTFPLHRSHGISSSSGAIIVGVALREEAMARFVLTGMDVGPQDLDAQLPALVVDVRMLPGADRPDYYIGRLETPIRSHPPATFDMARGPASSRGGR